MNIEDVEAGKFYDSGLKSKAVSSLVLFLSRRRLLTIRLVRNLIARVEQDKRWALIQKLRPFAKIAAKQVGEEGLRCVLAENAAEELYKIRLTRLGGIQKSNLENSIVRESYYSHQVTTSHTEVHKNAFFELEDPTKTQKETRTKKMPNFISLNGSNSQQSIRRAIEYGLKHKFDRNVHTALKNQKLGQLELKNLARRFMKEGSQGICEACDIYSNNIAFKF